MACTNDMVGHILAEGKVFNRSVSRNLADDPWGRVAHVTSVARCISTKAVAGAPEYPRVVVRKVSSMFCAAQCNLLNIAVPIHSLEQGAQSGYGQDGKRAEAQHLD